MTVKELRRIIKQVADDTEIILYCKHGLNRAFFPIHGATREFRKDYMMIALHQDWNKELGELPEKKEG